MRKTNTLSWNDRFALIDHYKPSDSRIVTVFGVSTVELNTAREMRNLGSFKPTINFDVNKFKELFVMQDGDPNNAPYTIQRNLPPETAFSAPKKRGRKGTKIKKAFAAITYTPVSVEEFTRQHDISLPVLRQHKRFDPTPSLGKVNVRQKKFPNGKKLMIWRDEPENPNT